MTVGLVHSSNIEKNIT